MASKGMIVLIVVAVFGLLLYEPVPKGYSTPSTFRMSVLAATVKAVKYVAHISEMISPGSQVKVLRAACKLAPSVGPPADESVVRSYDTDLAGVPVRVYEPVGREGALPGIVYYHGGGFVLCDIECFDRTVRKLSELTQTVIASVKLAPEHHYPTAHEDCLKATKHFINNANKFNVDPTRIAVAGDSAGGNLAATTSLRLRDENHSPPIKLQVLIFPTVQFIDLTLPSFLDNKHDPMLKTPDVAFLYPVYLNQVDHLDVFASNEHVPAAVKQKLSQSFIDLDQLPSKYTAHFTQPKPKAGDQKMWGKIKGALLNPYFTPLIAPKLEGLPRAYVYVGEHDVLRDDGILYARRLKDAGVKVELHSDPLGFHCNFLFALQYPEVLAAFRKMADYIVEHL